ncbi:hypothetical protein HK104_005880 [Borealophlyctis nickersoniae]|nr:hypothetical protein HK104_005880 [Borealophlyctis nickersoniae]
MGDKSTSHKNITGKRREVDDDGLPSGTPPSKISRRAPQKTKFFGEDVLDAADVGKIQPDQNALTEREKLLKWAEVGCKVIEKARKWGEGKARMEQANQQLEADRDNEASRVAEWTRQLHIQTTAVAKREVEVAERETAIAEHDGKLEANVAYLQAAVMELGAILPELGWERAASPIGTHTDRRMADPRNNSRIEQSAEPGFARLGSFNFKIVKAQGGRQGRFGLKGPKDTNQVPAVDFQIRDLQEVGDPQKDGNPPPPYRIDLSAQVNSVSTPYGPSQWQDLLQGILVDGSVVKLYPEKCDRALPSFMDHWYWLIRVRKRQSKKKVVKPRRPNRKREQTERGKHRPRTWLKPLRFPVIRSPSPTSSDSDSSDTTDSSSVTTVTVPSDSENSSKPKTPRQRARESSPELPKEEQEPEPDAKVKTLIDEGGPADIITLPSPALHSDWGVASKPSLPPPEPNAEEILHNILTIPKGSDNNYHCPIPHCGRRFDRRYNLKTHFAATHARQRTFACGDCGRRFTRKYDVERHAKTQHNALPRVSIVRKEENSLPSIAQDNMNGMPGPMPIIKSVADIVNGTAGLVPASPNVAGYAIGGAAFQAPIVKSVADIVNGMGMASHTGMIKTNPDDWNATGVVHDGPKIVFDDAAGSSLDVGVKTMAQRAEAVTTN